ncbi:MAG: beta-lactamase family protein [Chloroflexi bacterium]|nr:beta-lactamase family protein [Chloroflexota bacterium]
MQLRTYPMAVLLVLALALGPLGAALAQGDEITLVPFTNETFGLQGMIPEGWNEAAPGVYARGAGMTDLASLIIQAAPGMTADALAGMLLPQLGIDALPESAGTLETDAYNWTLYEIEVEQAGLSITVDLALAENEAGVTLVLLQTLADEHEALHEAVFIPAVEAVAPAGVDAGAGEGAASGAADTYEDPDGRFSVPIPTNWSIEEREGYTYLYSPDELLNVSIVVVDTIDPEAAAEEAWAVVDPDFDRAIEQTDEIPFPPHDLFVLYTYEMGEDEEFVYQIEVRVYGDEAHVLIFKADLEEAQRRQSQLAIIDTGYDITAIEDTDLTTVEPLPLTEELLAEFEAYIETALETYDTPGAAVAIVRDGEIVYANGFGVRNPAGDPVTPETLMMIGSTTKTMTTLLMAQMVDEGVFDWETPAIEVLPTFAVAEPDITQSITMENLVCACTGVPRRDLELIIQAEDLTAEGMLESLETFEFFTDFGEAFQYSNQMVSAAGFLTTIAAGGELGTLYEDYVSLMEERVFTPLGMDSTTFSFEEVLAGDDYAVPYGLFLDFTFQPISFDLEEYWLEPIAPAGAAWSNVLDMGRYMLMELNEGVAPDGTRIVSAENLAHTWQPQVAISATDDYGLGWIVSDYHGLQLLSHDGNTLGFTAAFAFLPEQDLGIVVLTNQRISLLNTTVSARLLELIFEQPPTADDEMQFTFNLFRDQYLELAEDAERITAPDLVEPLVGTYTNEALGDVTISVNEEGVLIFDSSEFQSELWHYVSSEEIMDEAAAPLEGAGPEAVAVPTEEAAEPTAEVEPTEEAGDTGEISFLFYDPPLTGTGITFEQDDAGVWQITLGGGLTEYIFERVE